MFHLYYIRLLRIHTYVSSVFILCHTFFQYVYIDTWHEYTYIPFSCIYSMWDSYVYTHIFHFFVYYVRLFFKRDLQTNTVLFAWNVFVIRRDLVYEKRPICNQKRPSIWKETYRPTPCSSPETSKETEDTKGDIYVYKYVISRDIPKRPIYTGKMRTYIWKKKKKLKIPVDQHRPLRLMLQRRPTGSIETKCISYVQRDLVYEKRPICHQKRPRIWKDTYL